eukprot:132113-Chlamydomonas_euryale.AAC.3
MFCACLPACMRARAVVGSMYGGALKSTWEAKGLPKAARGAGPSLHMWMFVAVVALLGRRREMPWYRRSVFEERSTQRNMQHSMPHTRVRPDLAPARCGWRHSVSGGGEGKIARAAHTAPARPDDATTACAP